MATIDTLVVNLVARHKRFVDGVTRAQKSLLGMTKTATTMAGSMLGLAGGFTAVTSASLLMGRAFSRTNQFQQDMANSTAIMTDLTDGLRRKMEDATRVMSFETRFSANEGAKAFYYLASAGLDAQQSIAALPQVARFAQAGNFDLALATDLATDAQSALGLTVRDSARNLENLTRVTDVLIGANTLANASAEQFSLSLTNKAGAALKLVNKDIEEGVAVLAAYADQGIKGEEAGTAFGIVMRDLTTKAIQNEEAFKTAGVAVFDQADNMRNLADIIGDLENRLDGLSDAQKKQTLLGLGFADKSVAYLQVLLGTSEKIRGYEEALRDAGGATADVANKQLTPMTRALSRLSSGFDRLSASLLSHVLDDIAESLEKIGGGMFMANLNGKKFADFVRLLTNNMLQLKGTMKDMGIEIGTWVNGFMDAWSQIEVAALDAEIMVKKAGIWANRDLRKSSLIEGIFGPLNDSSMDGELEALFEKRGEWVRFRNGLYDVAESQAEAQEAATGHTAALQAQEQEVRKYFDLQMEMQKRMQAQMDEASALHEAEQKIRDMQDAARNLTDSLLTPFEQFRRELDEIQMLFDKGMLSAEFFDRAMDSASSSFADAIDKQSALEAPGSNLAVRAGSEAAFQAQDRQRNRSATERAQAEQRKGIKAQIEAAKSLQSIDRNLKNNAPVQVQQVSLV